MNTVKFLLSLFIVIAILSCNKISEKVEEKVNEKIDETIDENLKKLDSTFSDTELDSLQIKLDSILQKMDSTIIEEKKKK